MSEERGDELTEEIGLAFSCEANGSEVSGFETPVTVGTMSISQTP